MGRNVVSVFAIALTFALASAIAASSTADDVAFPTNFRDWFVVNSMIVTKNSPISDQLGGMHIIHVNAKGMATLRNGGPFPYPDGTVFADDVHEFSTKDGAYIEGAKKVVAVMVKDTKKYPTTGGWGFQVWAGGDPSKPLVPDSAHAVQSCFTCHTPQKDRDFTFSEFIP